MIRRLDSPPGDDRLGWRGLVDLPYPFSPALDPINRGVRIILQDGNDTVLTDATIPGGLYDPVLQRGWVLGKTGKVYTYKQVGNIVPLIGGIRRVVLRDYTSRVPGRIKFAVAGRDGSFAAAALPVRGTVIFDSPNATGGQCADHQFPGPEPQPACTQPVSDLILCH